MKLQIYYKNPLLIIILGSLLVSSCLVKSSSGSIQITKMGKETHMSFFNYYMLSNKIRVSAKINNMNYEGKIFSSKEIKKSLIVQFPHMDKRQVKNSSQYSILKMVSIDGKNAIECLIKQDSAHSFGRGGRGACYDASSRRIFDILIDPANY